MAKGKKLKIKKAAISKLSEKELTDANGGTCWLLSGTVDRIRDNELKGREIT